jgi:hypothetical protein
VNVDALPELDARWQSAFAAGDSAIANPGALACTFVLRGAMRTADRRWRQGLRNPQLPMDLDDFAVATLAQRHVFRVEEHVATGLNAWAHGRRRLHARFAIPDPLELLAFQARGERIVSLLPEGVPTGLEKSNFEFALHDLCHAEKFFDPQHFAGQVGLFASVHRALSTAAWVEMTRDFADPWQAEFNHVAADMNGSPLFLFAALRRKVQNAALSARQNPETARDWLCHALQLPGDVMASGVRFTVHPDIDPAEIRHHAAVLLAHFEAVGSEILGSVIPPP